MEQQVCDAQKVGQRFPFLTYNGILQFFSICRRANIPAHIFKCRGEEASRSTGEVAKGFAQFRVEHHHNKISQCTWCVELSGISCRLQIFQNSLINISECVTVVSIVKFDFVYNVDHLAQKRSILHILVQVCKCFLNNAFSSWGIGIYREILQARKQFLIDERE